VAKPSVCVVIPVKAFALSKMRLSEVLSEQERSQLAQQLATAVVLAAAPHDVVIACEEDSVADWAQRLGARVVRTDGAGLSGSVQATVEELSHEEIDIVVVAHGDLAAPHGLSDFISGLAAGEVAIIPDRHGDGTNVIAVPTSAGFQFAYGPESADRHAKEAARVGLRCKIVTNSPLDWDVDVPADLAADLAADRAIDLAAGEGDLPQP